jgi:hypothetical protein
MALRAEINVRQDGHADALRTVCGLDTMSDVNLALAELLHDVHEMARPPTKEDSGLAMSIYIVGAAGAQVCFCLFERVKALELAVDTLHLPFTFIPGMVDPRYPPASDGVELPTLAWPGRRRGRSNRLGGRFHARTLLPC